ncbi:hypothetical protein AOE55_00010 (plasmid) [Candidatus Riesia pediculicola]|nr:hypothetical protein AOE55_00010 [Candidatus Riesia pediculicola]
MISKEIFDMFLEKSIISCRKKLNSVSCPIIFVPTMGNLHEGHLRMISFAKKRRSSDFLVVSIFVNPIQFEREEDYISYPRTIDSDLRLLDALGVVDLVFFPEESQMYPNGTSRITLVNHPISEELEGFFRPGHFSGVGTILVKFFNIIRPSYLYLGEKDYQQLLMVRKLVIDLDYPLKVVGFPIVRDKEGLAYSSRNSLLSKEERLVAFRLNSTLNEVVEQFTSKNLLSEKDLSRHFQRRISRFGFVVESFLVRDSLSLLPISSDSRKVIFLASVWLGSVRLIDNKCVSMNSHT